MKRRTKMKNNSKLKKQKHQSSIDFKGMAFFFKIRDIFKPPIKKIRNSNIKRGDYVLDYGCGPGSYSFAAAEVVGMEGRIYAADIHPIAIKTVKKKVLKKNIQNIKKDSDTAKKTVEEKKKQYEHVQKKYDEMIIQKEAFEERKQIKEKISALQRKIQERQKKITEKSKHLL